MKKCMDRVCTSEMMIDLGDLYVSVKNNKKAEDSYLNSFYMVPCRVIPLHKLLLLYEQMGNVEEAIAVAHAIINLKVSVESSLTLRIREDAKRIVQNSSI